ncbi:diaminopimelate epimerase [Sphingobacterium sp. SGG-5]|uniref:diaminopimelate epimerase n=1 Tax=Sphingobacterium sp. SGG-5 TaxID=2710881 RepID=UPI0013EDAA59|nr:diaminopimelate epimerase [Sphingobacterium sp. SGG-5]NGM62395.1 diaminopimelate epimerase [Sphingobacterium sp. SGG-5]
MQEKIKFYKYQGAGNDFILIDNRTGFFDGNNIDLIHRLCDRRFGIGADGLMLLQDKKNFDFEMLYYNADGREGSMCGNGGRCIVAFARDLGIIAHKADFLAVDGTHRATIADNQVNLGMVDVHEIHRDGDAYVLNTGSPHYVKMVEDLRHYPVYNEGYAIRNNETYQEKGINVNFVEKENDGYFVRTFERGVENETLACGTGATAAAIAMALQENRTGALEVPIRVLGGQLSISFTQEGDHFRNVFLKGPADLVFEGKF